MKKTIRFVASTALVAGVSLAFAQAPAWQQGRPDALKDSKLAPNAAKMTVTPAAEIPLSKLTLPPGFKIEVWAEGLVGARQIAMNDDQSKFWVGTRGIGRVYEVADYGDRRNVRVLAEKMNQPGGVAFKNGTLWVFAIDKVLRYDGIEANYGTNPKDVTAAFNLPKEQHHNWKYVRFGPDGKLYVPFGAPCNICEPPSKEYAQIRRYNADGSGMQVIATGVRNTQGFDWHPKTRELWFTDHGRDWLGDDGPEDELNRLSKPGQFFGFPYCHANGVADPDIKRADACKGVTLPVTTMGPHAAAMDLHFYTGKMFPAEYQGVAFVARKGSWNRTKKFGYDVVTVRAGADGKGAKIVPFMTGFMNAADNTFWGRPSHLAQLKDGSLLVTDEQLGAIYRISYSAAAAKKK